jgi:glucose-6-phosphate isomerase
MLEDDIQYLTPVGLLPIAVAGFDIRQFVAGAKAMKEIVTKAKTIDENPAFKYVAARNALYRSGKPVEIMVNYQPSLTFITEWWKQLLVKVKESKTEESSRPE